MVNRKVLESRSKIDPCQIPSYPKRPDAASKTNEVRFSASTTQIVHTDFCNHITFIAVDECKRSCNTSCQTKCDRRNGPSYCVHRATAQETKSIVVVVGSGGRRWCRYGKYTLDGRHKLFSTMTQSQCSTQIYYLMNAEKDGDQVTAPKVTVEEPAKISK